MTFAGRPLGHAELDAGIAFCRKFSEEHLSSCFEQYVLPLHRLDREIERRKLDQTATGRRVTAGVLYQALYEKTAREVRVGEDEIEAYLGEHQRDFEKPLRLRLFRILVPSSSEAKQLIAELHPDTTPQEFRALVRTHSKDQATLERGGDLGFVWPDGTTDVPQLKAERSLYEAATQVPDGAFVPKPVPELEQFAVVWRRGSLPAVKLDRPKASTIARERLTEKKTHAHLDGIVKSKRPHVRGELLSKLKRPECKIFSR